MQVLPGVDEPLLLIEFLLRCRDSLLYGPGHFSGIGTAPPGLHAPHDGFADRRNEEQPDAEGRWGRNEDTDHGLFYDDAAWLLVAAAADASI